jgi:GAF domain-containing protein
VGAVERWKSSFRVTDYYCQVMQNVDMPVTSGERLDDPRRLAALQASGLLHRTESERLDILCAATAQMLDVPICQVNVLDATSQYHLGTYPPKELWARIAPAVDSGCQVVVMRRGPVAINDAREDAVLCHITPVITGQIRSYLGTPILHDGHVVGTFCVADEKVRDWNELDLRVLQALGRKAELAVDFL